MAKVKWGEGHHARLGIVIGRVTVPCKPRKYPLPSEAAWDRRSLFAAHVAPDTPMHSAMLDLPLHIARAAAGLLLLMCHSIKLKRNSYCE
jgi:hypothetical protein